MNLKIRPIVSLDSNILIRALQKDRAKQVTDPRLLPSKVRGLLVALVGSSSPFWSLHNAQIIELISVVQRIIDNKGTSDIAFDEAELENASELLNYLNVLKSKLEAGGTVQGVIYTSPNSPAGNAIYELTVHLWADAKQWIELGSKKRTDPTTDILIYLTALHHGQKQTNAKNLLFTEDADLEAIERRVKRIFETVQRQTSDKYGSMPLLQQSFYQYFCYSHTDKRKTVALLPNVELHLLKNMNLGSVKGVNDSITKIAKRLTPDIS